MRIGLKFTLAIVALLVPVLAVEAALRLDYEGQQFEDDVRHSQRLLGRAVRPSAELAWRAEGFAAAQEIVRRTRAGESEISIRLVALEPGAPGATPVGLPGGTPTQGANTELTWTDHSVHPAVVYTYLPIEAPDGGRGTAIELAESLRESEARLRNAGLRVLATAVALIVGCAAVAITLGEWLLGRPIRLLAMRASQIATGDLGPLPHTKRRDEVGQLSGALAAMVDGLKRARDGEAREAEARIEAERRLRRGERLAAIGTLAAGVAHELGSPLQIVSGRARMVESDPGASDASTRNASLIREQAARMERIVRQLLRLSHPANGERAHVDLGRLVRDTLELLRPEAEERGIEIALEVEGEVDVKGDPDELGQVLTNLVRNAFAAADAHVWVRVARDRVPRSIDGKAPPRADWVCVEVRDDGPGIGRAIQPHIFDPFFTTKEVGEGTGLGLALAHNIATDHNGWLELDTSFSDGALFRLLLPVPEPAKA